ncbi:hypothetical protein BDM02DRAFT_3263685 [Thelephora ganbajun]|uniref:Uncharacterized protein n=1 Tax=Thelephora ganbajun TaxID=370292 RepID=A0ACB6Z3S6_THEGA|nr:hypothetical protein BDM02DRAFT_3263685 [Thelephora ganbajun]
MSSGVLKEIIDDGHDVVSSKYYEVAVATIFFYDYLLTLADEIKYAWHGRKSWVFVLFLVNRYSPFGYQIWVLLLGYRQTFTQRVCEKTAFFSALAFTVSALLAQVVLTLRVYAITGQNRIITACFGVITMSQFTIGLYSSVVMATQGALQFPPIPLDAYRICIFVRHRPLEIGFTTISLLYDFLAFALIIYLVARSNVYKFPIPSLLRTIAQDATLYFLVIFTSHLVLELTLLFARPTIQLLPGTGNLVYLPVMVTRLMLSLKKSNASQTYAWSLAKPTVHTTMAFAERRGFAGTGDEVHLDTYPSGQGGTQSQA